MKIRNLLSSSIAPRMVYLYYADMLKKIANLLSEPAAIDDRSDERDIVLPVWAVVIIVILLFALMIATPWPDTVF